MVLMDTHIWLWWLLGDGALIPAERVALDELASQKKLALSWTSVWEMEMLERKGRIQISIPLEKWLEKATHPDVCTLWPVDTEVVLNQRKLPEDFHADPADRLITSTAMLAQCALATYDGKIRASEVVEIWMVKN